MLFGFFKVTDNKNTDNTEDKHSWYWKATQYLLGKKNLENTFPQYNETLSSGYLNKTDKQKDRVSTKLTSPPPPPPYILAAATTCNYLILIQYLYHGAVERVDNLILSQSAGKQE